MDTNSPVDSAILFIRVTLGVIFLAHGLQKTFGLFGGPGVEGVTGMLKGMGFAFPGIWAWILCLTELMGGLFLILGILPRISAALIAIVMVVAIAKVHGPKGLLGQGGFEYPLLILMTCISLMITGGGKFSLFDKF